MSFQEAYLAAPPVSRTITAAAVLLSVPGHLGLYSIFWVVFVRDHVLTFQQLPEIWRLVTAFFVTGGGLGLIFDPFFLWQYSSQLETGAPRFSAPGAYVYYLLFVSLVVLLTGGFVLNGLFLLPPVTMALMYTFSQEDPNRNIHFFIVNIPAMYLPYASLAVTYLTQGPFATMIQATGILAAHAYDFLDRIWPQFGGGQRYIQVPQILRKYFANASPNGNERSYGRSFAPRNDGARADPLHPHQVGPGGAWSSGTGWDGRGVGRRLG